MCSNASTTAGSNWTPRSRRISARASARGQAALYGRAWRERVEDVCQRDDPRRERDLVAGEAGTDSPVPSHHSWWNAAISSAALRISDPLPARIERPISACVLIDVELLAAQRAGLQKDRIRDAHFADVVQEGRLTDQRHRRPVEAELEGDPGCHVRDPVGVGLRVVVAILGGEREPRQRLVVGVGELARRSLELERALVHRLLQPCLVVALARLELLPLGDVAGDGEHLAGLEVGSRRPLEPAVGAVLGAVAVLEVEDLLAVGLVGGRRERRLDVVRVDLLEDRPGEELLTRVAEQAGDRGLTRVKRPSKFDVTNMSSENS